MVPSCLWRFAKHIMHVKRQAILNIVNNYRPKLITVTQRKTRGVYIAHNMIFFPLPLFPKLYFFPQEQCKFPLFPRLPPYIRVFS